MRLTGIKVGDIVQAEVKGQRFHGRVTETLGQGAELAGGRIVIESLNGVSLGYSQLRSRQVIGHYRKAAGSA